VKNFKRLLRRRKTLIVAFIAALGSFVMGVTLPLNPRGNQPASLSQAQLVTASQSQVQQSKSIVNNLKQSIAERVEFSENTLDRLQKVRFNSSLPSKFKGTTLRQAKLDSRQKAIALTFDDGPWPKTTVQILDILKQNNIKGTFFWVGRYLQVYPELGKKVAQAGHAIGNHTWNHQYIKYNEEGNRHQNIYVPPTGRYFKQWISSLCSKEKLYSCDVVC